MLGDVTLKFTVPEEEESQWQWPKAWRYTLQGPGHRTNLDAFSGQHYGGLTWADTIDTITKKRSYAKRIPGPRQIPEEPYRVDGSTRDENCLSDAHGSHDDVRATGVQYPTNSGETGLETAKKGVIISAGTIGSPKLLELSGVGDEKVLKLQGIDIVISNSFVGEDLQNHSMCFLSFVLRPDGENEG
ncbi:unnamed protein product [Discula destructiva]